MRSACESQLCVNKNERTQKDEESNRFFPVFVICCIAVSDFLPVNIFRIDATSSFSLQQFICLLFKTLFHCLSVIFLPAAAINQNGSQRPPACPAAIQAPF